MHIVGFADEERHAINTLMRLSEDREPIYTLWSPSHGEAPDLVLADGESFSAGAEIASMEARSDQHLLWFGSGAPERSRFVFQRPIQWSLVVDAMDTLFAPPTTVDIDFDLDLGFAAEPEPAPEVPTPPPGPRVLVIDPDPDRSFYWRAKLVLAGLPFMDDAPTLDAARALMAQQRYDLIVLDEPGNRPEGWAFAGDAVKGGVMVFLALPGAPLMQRLRARFAGIHACLCLPLEPDQLYTTLRREASGLRARVRAREGAVTVPSAS